MVVSANPPPDVAHMERHSWLAVTVVRSVSALAPEFKRPRFRRSLDDKSLFVSPQYFGHASRPAM